jgi:anti-anti-sigma regulatory factor
LHACITAKIDAVQAIKLDDSLFQMSKEENEVMVDFNDVEDASVAALGVLINATHTFKKVVAVNVCDQVFNKMLILGVTKLIQTL